MAEQPEDRDAAAAREQEQEVEAAKEEIHRLEEGDPPGKLEDWPSGRAKYITYGGPEGTAGYDEGPTRKLGPSSLEHHEDGSVSIDGEKVDNPEDFKGEPLPGSPADDGSNGATGSGSNGATGPGSDGATGDGSG